jgi:hypothetical protein
VRKSLKSFKSVDMIRGHYTAAVLFERSAEVSQDPQCQQIDAEERLGPGHRPHPASGAQHILAGLHAGNPGPQIEPAARKLYADHRVV